MQRLYNQAPWDIRVASPIHTNSRLKPRPTAFVGRALAQSGRVGYNRIEFCSSTV